MSDLVAEDPGASTDRPVPARLSVRDRYLPVRLLAAMALGLALGRAVPGLDDAFDASGACEQPDPLGGSGLPALGAAEAAPFSAGPGYEQVRSTAAQARR